MAPFPTTTIPVLPLTEACLWQVHKKAEGRLATKLDLKIYDCKTGPTRRGWANLELKLWSAGKPCDQEPGWPPDGSLLKAPEGRIIFRMGKEPGEHLGIFVGNFTITSDKLPTILLGRITLILHIGTHHEPFGPESCHQLNHVEGWLVGANGATELPPRYLNALLVSKMEPIDKEGVIKLYSGFLNGVEVIPR